MKRKWVLLTWLLSASMILNACGHSGDLDASGETETSENGSSKDGFGIRGYENLEKVGEIPFQKGGREDFQRMLIDTDYDGCVMVGYYEFDLIRDPNIVEYIYDKTPYRDRYGDYYPTTDYNSYDNYEYYNGYDSYYNYYDNSYNYDFSDYYTPPTGGATGYYGNESGYTTETGETRESWETQESSSSGYETRETTQQTIQESVADDPGSRREISETEEPVIKESQAESTGQADQVSKNDNIVESSTRKVLLSCYQSKSGTYQMQRLRTNGHSDHGSSAGQESDYAKNYGSGAQRESESLGEEMDEITQESDAETLYGTDESISYYDNYENNDNYYNGSSEMEFGDSFLDSGEENLQESGFLAEFATEENVETEYNEFDLTQGDELEAVLILNQNNEKYIGVVVSDEQVLGKCFEADYHAKREADFECYAIPVGTEVHVIINYPIADTDATGVVFTVRNEEEFAGIPVAMPEQSARLMFDRRGDLLVLQSSHRGTVELDGTEKKVGDGLWTGQTYLPYPFYYKDKTYIEYPARSVTLKECKAKFEFPDASFYPKGMKEPQEMQCIERADNRLDVNMAFATENGYLFRSFVYQLCDSGDLYDQMGTFDGYFTEGLETGEFLENSDGKQIDYQTDLVDVEQVKQLLQTMRDFVGVDIYVQEKTDYSNISETEKASMISTFLVEERKKGNEDCYYLNTCLKDQKTGLDYETEENVQLAAKDLFGTELDLSQLTESEDPIGLHYKNNKFYYYYGDWGAAFPSVNVKTVTVASKKDKTYRVKGEVYEVCTDGIIESKSYGSEGVHYEAVIKENAAAYYGYTIESLQITEISEEEPETEETLETEMETDSMYETDMGYGVEQENGYGNTYGTDAGYGTENGYGNDYGTDAGYGTEYGYGNDYGTDAGYGTEYGYGNDYGTDAGYGTEYGYGNTYGTDAGYGSNDGYGTESGHGADNNYGNNERNNYGSEPNSGDTIRKEIPSETIQGAVQGLVQVMYLIQGYM